MSKDTVAPPKEEKTTGSLAVLVAENDTVLRNSVANYLNAQKYQTTIAANAKEAAAAIAKTRTSDVRSP